MVHFPLLPVEDEGRLNNPVLRENFIERIFALKLWREVLKKKENRGNLVDFHARHKLLISGAQPQALSDDGEACGRAKKHFLAGTHPAIPGSASGIPEAENDPEKKYQCFAAHNGIFQKTIIHQMKRENYWK